MNVRPLARTLSPFPEESLPGFLLRLAYRLERSPARIAYLCGLIRRQNRIPAEYLLSLPAEGVGPFAAATRLSMKEANALTLSSFAAVYPPLASVRIDGNRNTTAARKSWAASVSSRYCAACLSGNGSSTQTLYGGPWKLRWHLPISYACVTHRTVLSHACPRCGGTPNQPKNTERQGLVMSRTMSGLHPALCRHFVSALQGPSTAPCAARLDHDRQVVRVPETDLSTLLALQHQIDQRLLYGQSSNSGEQLVSDRYFFPDLIVAAHLIRLSWPDGSRYASSTWLANLIDRHVSAHAARRYASEPDGRAPITWDAPEDPTETAALLVAASTLLGHEERNDAGITNRVQPLAASAFSRNAANIGASLRRMDVSPAVARALLRHSLGFYSAGGHRHARQHIPSRQSHFGINHVPALLPHTWLSGPFDELLYRWASQTDWKVRHLRRVTALKLAEMSGGGTWPDCAKALRIPWNTAQQSLKVVRQELNSRDLWPDLEQAIECVANKLDCGTGRIDYGRRRELLSSWQVPADDWVKLCRGLHQGGQGNTSPTSDTATVLIWTYVTQGDHLHSPLLGALRESNSTTRLLVASINQLCTPAHRKGSKRELLHRLQTYSDTIATACDRPVTSLQTRDIELAVHLSRATTP